MRVYFGDIDEKKQKIIWKDFDHSEKTLDEENLEPVDGVAPFQDDGEAQI
jgi:cation-transporting ATPase 13A2